MERSDPELKKFYLWVRWQGTIQRHQIETEYWHQGDKAEPSGGTRETVVNRFEVTCSRVGLHPVLECVLNQNFNMCFALLTPQGSVGIKYPRQGFLLMLPVLWQWNKSNNLHQTLYAHYNVMHIYTYLIWMSLPLVCLFKLWLYIICMSENVAAPLYKSCLSRNIYSHNEDKLKACTMRISMCTPCISILFYCICQSVAIATQAEED